MSASTDGDKAGALNSGGSLKTLALAFLLVLGASSIVFFVLSKFGVGSEIAGPIAGSFFYAITYVSQKLDSGKSARGAGLLPAGVVEFPDFSMPFYLMFFYAVIIILTTMEISSAFSGLVADVLHIGEASILPTLAASSLIINLTGVFLVGRWIGTRASGYRAGVTVAACVFASVCGHMIDYAVFPAQTATVFGMPDDLGFLLAQCAVGSLLFSVAGAIGCGVGYANRMSAYFNYLLKRIPRATRETMLSIAYEEASRLSREN